MILLCGKKDPDFGDCPYDYSNNPERDIEGMPLMDENDERRCPIYGHACPVFMEDFGLTPEALRIRAEQGFKVLPCPGDNF